MLGSTNSITGSSTYQAKLILKAVVEGEIGRAHV